MTFSGHDHRPLDPALAGALACAAGAFARLDQALASHPLRPAFLHRARLEAVRRQAAVDGQAIDPWHLAAVLEGLRLRMDGALRIIDRGAISPPPATRSSCTSGWWHRISTRRARSSAPNRSSRPRRPAPPRCSPPPPGCTPGSANAPAERAHGGGARARPLRAALVRFWVTTACCGRRCR